VGGDDDDGLEVVIGCGYGVSWVRVWGCRVVRRTCNLIW